MTATVLDLARSRVLDVDAAALEALEVPRRRGPVDFDRVEGMLLGLAIGDALGNTTEGQTAGQRRTRYGEIRDYRRNRYADDQPVGLPSDDGQLAFWTLEHLLEHGRIVPEALADTFARRRIFGIGKSVKRFQEALRSGAPWHRAAQPSAGNGAVMRIAPVVIPHLREPSRALWDDAVLGGAVTHNDTSSISACVGLAGILWDLLEMPGAPPGAWWLDRYCALAGPLDRDVRLRPRRAGLDFEGPISALVDTEVRAALSRGLGVLEACERWYSGAFLLETMPSALYVLAWHGDDPEEAIVRAVNDMKDNDTIAAIVGACVGALHGKRALPRRWIDGLLGRTGAEDDGHIFTLVEEARRRWS